MTPAETRLWFEFLQHATPRVRRQRPFAGYVLDFYCAQLKLTLELDGSSHDTEDAQSYDEARTETLEAAGLKVMRFTNDEVLNNLSAVLESLRHLGLSRK